MSYSIEFMNLDDAKQICNITSNVEFKEFIKYKEILISTKLVYDIFYCPSMVIDASILIESRQHNTTDYIVIEEVVDGKRYDCIFLKKYFENSLKKIINKFDNLLVYK